MERGIVRRFRGRVIAVHWLHTVPFFLLVITGVLMFFGLTGFGGAARVRLFHLIAAAAFVAVPIIYSVVDIRSALGFLKDAFDWDGGSRTWLTASPGFYFGRRKEMPAQGRINGDQRLWLLIVLVTGALSTATGGILWFLRLEMSVELYQWVRLIHDASFLVASVLFPIHFYLRALHPWFNESLASMLNGRVSETYAREKYPEWHAGASKADPPEKREETPG